jgi:hypothetical protein
MNRPPVPASEGRDMIISLPRLFCLAVMGGRGERLNGFAGTGVGEHAAAAVSVYADQGGTVHVHRLTN